MDSTDLRWIITNKRAANMIQQKIVNCYSMLYQQQIREAMVNPFGLLNTMKHAIILKIASLAQPKREESNQEFWRRIFNHTMRDVFEKYVGEESEHLHRGVPLIIIRFLEADFQCSNCFKRWDSTHVRVKVLYEVHKASRNGIESLEGRIKLEEINRQRCHDCVRIFEFPIYTEESAGSLAEDVIEKIYLKYFMETLPQTEKEEREKKEKKRNHEKNNCEYCLQEGISAEGRWSGPVDDEYEMKETKPAKAIGKLNTPMKINWTLEVFGDIMPLGNIL